MYGEPTTRTGATPTHELAAAPVRQLAFDDAVRVCRSNHWDGVLRAIRPRRRRPRHAVLDPARRRPPGRAERRPMGALLSRPNAGPGDRGTLAGLVAAAALAPLLGAVVVAVYTAIRAGIL